MESCKVEGVGLHSVEYAGFESGGRAFAVKVVPKRLPVFPFSGFDLYHHFRNDAFYDLYNLEKSGKRNSSKG